MKVTAQFLSVLFHPIFVPLYVLVLLMFTESQPESFLVNDSLYYIDGSIKFVLLLLYAIFTLITPLLSMVFFKLSNNISDFYLRTQKERTLPLLSTAFYFILLYGFMEYSLPKTVFPRIVTIIPMAAAVVLVVTSILNQRIKLSLHLLGMGMGTATIWVYFVHQSSFQLTFLLVAVLLSGIIATARIYIGAHALKEVGWAFFLSFSIQAILLELFAYVFV